MRAVVTDQILPKGMTGVELARQARERHPDLGFVFISGYADAFDSAVVALESQDRFLSKPFSQKSLAGALRSAMERPAMTG